MPEICGCVKTRRSDKNTNALWRCGRRIDKRQLVAGQTFAVVGSAFITDFISSYAIINYAGPDGVRNAYNIQIALGPLIVHASLLANAFPHIAFSFRIFFTHPYGPLTLDRLIAKKQQHSGEYEKSGRQKKQIGPTHISSLKIDSRGKSL